MTVPSTSSTGMAMDFLRGKSNTSYIHGLDLSSFNTPLPLHSEYYDAFVSIRRGLFNTRDRAEHTRKRKMVSHTFSTKSIGQFEQYIHANIELFVKQWNGLCDRQTDPKTGFASIDALNWFNYLA